MPSGESDKAQNGKNDDDCTDDINDLIHGISFRLIRLASLPSGVAGRNVAHVCGGAPRRHSTLWRQLDNPSLKSGDAIGARVISFRISVYRAAQPL